MEIKVTENLPQEVKSNNVTDLLNEKAKQENDVKKSIDLLATKTALERDGTVEKLVNEKTEELRNDAEAKRVQAETDRINKEVEKVKAEKQKEIEEYDKLIQAKEKEVQRLKAESDEAQAYYESNKDILKYALIRSKKSLGVMKFWLYPASIVFLVIQILMLPITFCGLVLENVIDIVGGVGGSIKNNAMKITISVLVIILIVAVVFVTYAFGGKLIGIIG